jgi:hypothetical protein
MYKLLDIKKSSRAGKKWVAVFEDMETGRQKQTHFGASGYQDYTQSKDPERARLYRMRHKKDLETNDPTRAGFLSYYILWSSPNMSRNISEYKKRFHL